VRRWPAKHCSRLFFDDEPCEGIRQRAQICDVGQFEKQPLVVGTTNLVPLDSISNWINVFDAGGKSPGLHAPDSLVVARGVEQAPLEKIGRKFIIAVRLVQGVISSAAAAPPGVRWNTTGDPPRAREVLTHGEYLRPGVFV
jgi:hypothetical protein